MNSNGLTRDPNFIEDFSYRVFVAIDGVRKRQLGSVLCHVV